MPPALPPQRDPHGLRLIPLLRHAGQLFALMSPADILLQTCREALSSSGARSAFASFAAAGQSPEGRLHVRIGGERDDVSAAAVSAMFSIRRRLALRGEPATLVRSADTAAIFEALASNGGTATDVVWACPLVDRSRRHVGEVALLMAAPPEAELVELLQELASLAVAALENARRHAFARYDQEKLLFLAEASDEALWDWNLDTGELWWGRGIYKMLGSDRVDVKQKAQWKLELIHSADRARVHASFEQARSSISESVWREKYRLLLVDGSSTAVEDSGYFLREADGRAYRVVGAMRDISRMENLLELEREARMEAESASRTKDEFLAMLGHELRNPLAPILTAVELLRLRNLPEIDRERTIIERQSQHLVRLVDDLLDVSRVATGKIKLQSRRIDLHDVLARCVEMTTPLIQERGHSLQVALPRRPLPLVGDPARLAQVFGNLLINAAKYTEHGGHIQVEGTVLAGEVEVAIVDDGIGIAPELLPRLFDLFVQGGQELDRAKGGLGLGLSIVRSLTSLHAGTVEAHSDGPGRGSRFTVRLPLAAAGDAAQREAAAEPLASAAAPRTRRILVVDDNQDAAELLVEFLRRSGHETCLAHDGPSALACAAEFAPDVVLLDLGLPVLDGYEVARQLRLQPGGERLGLIAVTGYGQENDRRRAREASFNAHLVKPVSMQQLASAIAELETRLAPNPADTRSSLAVGTSSPEPRRDT